MSPGETDQKRDKDSNPVGPTRKMPNLIYKMSSKVNKKMPSFIFWIFFVILARSGQRNDLKQ